MIEFIAMFGIWALIIGFIMILSLARLALLIYAVIDISKAKNKGEWMAIWILICFIGGIIGSIIYLIVGRKNKK